MPDPTKDRSSSEKDVEVQCKEAKQQHDLDNPKQEEQTEHEEKPDKNEQYRKDNW